MLQSPDSTGPNSVSMAPTRSPWLLLEFGASGTILTHFPGVENAPTFAKEEADVVTVPIKAFPTGEYFKENSPHLTTQPEQTGTSESLTAQFQGADRAGHQVTSSGPTRKP